MTFNQQQWEKLKEIRTNIVIDIKHGYGLLNLLLSRLENLAQKEDVSIEELLSSLINISATSQQIAEELLPIERQTTIEQGNQELKERCDTLYEKLNDIHRFLCNESKRVEGFQKGASWYGIEFGEEFLKGIEEVLIENV